ncbi:MAG: DUF4065 domain-containing protein [Bacteroidales bacterium]|nr:DUF4065 domain-containing protein [Bacteroidales bacterium]MBQ8644892.1 DUF4065 domain-containing protein [Bacteroidales bacterium]
MNSPFTGKEMRLVYDKRTWTFRGEKFGYIHSSWYCADSGEYFTSDDMDDVGFLQVTNQYRVKYGIPFSDEIAAIRSLYGVSAARMSLIMGFGANQWRNYESGEVPSVSNGRMIKSIMNPEVFLDMVHSSKHILEQKDYDKLIKRINSILECNDSRVFEQYETNRLFMCERGADNGFGERSLQKLKNILLYIIGQCGELFCTKMNKMLFYADFLAYRDMGMSLTGLSYRALNYGPVPERWDRIYSQFDEVRLEPKVNGDKEGMIFIPEGDADLSFFSAEELKILDLVCGRFSECSAAEISKISHEEPAWIECSSKHSRIPYEYAFRLKAI